jgi:hypothetical protein
MYETFHGTNMYIHSLKTNNSHMYAYVQRKNVYTKQNTAKARVKPRNLDARKNAGCQATSDKQYQENREKIKEKNTQ